LLIQTFLNQVRFEFFEKYLFDKILVEQRKSNIKKACHSSEEKNLKNQEKILILDSCFTNVPIDRYLKIYFETKTVFA
jgi:N-glycosylase/DNA lyase